RPVIEPLPAIAARLESSDPGDVGRRAALQMLVEEGDHDILPEPLAGVAAPFERAERRSRAVLLPVMPETEHEMGVGTALHRREHGGGAVNVLLVPLAPDEQGGYGQRLRAEDFVDRLILPIFVIGGVLCQPDP